MPSSATPTSARATTDSATRAWPARPARRASTPTSSRISRTSWATSSGSAGGARRGPARGADLRFDLEIPFEESFAGAETTIQIPREEHCETCKGTGAAAGSSREVCDHCRGSGQVRYQQGFLVVARTCGQCGGTGQIVRKPCPDCRGAGRTAKDRRVTVRIPAGIADGQRLRLQGEGEHGSVGAPPGDLYVVIHVRPHPRFHRDGDDLYVDVPCALPDHGDGRLLQDRRAGG